MTLFFQYQNYLSIQVKITVLSQPLTSARSLRAQADREQVDPTATVARPQRAPAGLALAT